MDARGVEKLGKKMASTNPEVRSIAAGSSANAPKEFGTPRQFQTIPPPAVEPSQWGAGSGATE